LQHDHGLDAFARQGLERSVKFTGQADVDGRNRDRQFRSGGLDLAPLDEIRWIGNVDQDSELAWFGHNFERQLDQLAGQSIHAGQDARHIGSRPGFSGRQAHADGIGAGRAHDRDAGRCAFGRERRGRVSGHDHVGLEADQLFSEGRQVSEIAVGITLDESVVAAFNVAGLPEAPAECRDEVAVTLGCAWTKVPNHGKGRLLRARCERPCSRAAERWPVSKRVNSSKADTNDATLIDPLKQAA
jgi:hypothetical protein